MRALALLALLLAGCRTSSLPENGDQGGSKDLAAADGGARPCHLLCVFGLTCCNDQCVNLDNDIHNCGRCGNVCPGPQPFCNGQDCAPPPCTPACDGNQLCCEINGPGPTTGPKCVAPTDLGTCPIGCPLCQ